MKQCERKNLCKEKCIFSEHKQKEQRHCQQCGKPCHCWERTCYACEQEV